METRQIHTNTHFTWITACAVLFGVFVIFPLAHRLRLQLINGLLLLTCCLCWTLLMLAMRQGWMCTARSFPQYPDVTSNSGHVTSPGFFPSWTMCMQKFAKEQKVCRSSGIFTSSRLSLSSCLGSVFFTVMSAAPA